MIKGKILITGTGRAGTTLLVKILTELGLDTGFKDMPEDYRYFSEASAGLESAINELPRILKSPSFAENIDLILEEGYIINHVIIPIRDLEKATKSRERLGEGKGGFTGGSENYEEQEIFNAKIIYNLVNSLSKNKIPFTFLSFPMFAEDSEYLYDTLEFLFNEYRVSKEKVKKAVLNTYDKDKIRF